MSLSQCVIDGGGATLWVIRALSHNKGAPSQCPLLPVSGRNGAATQHVVKGHSRRGSFGKIQAGILENLSVFRGDTIQRWALSQKISLVGETQLVSSSVPALTSVRPGKAAASVAMGDPQSGQK